MNIHLTLSAAEQKGTVLAASPPLSQAAGPYGCLAAHAQNANGTVLDPSPIDGRGRFISYADSFNVVVQIKCVC